MIGSSVELAKTKIQAGQQAFDLDSLLPARVTASLVAAGSRARVLQEVLEQAHGDIRFDVIGSHTLTQLHLARVIEPRRIIPCYSDRRCGTPTRPARS